MASDDTHLRRCVAEADTDGETMRDAAERLSMTLAQRADHRTDALPLAVAAALPRLAPE
ncbi:hypothetical protein [Amycolatopsis lexingtonensis]|uniref:hypothetical protein n=1 Tax=Amycolatopsis lexingtonensis TaxID=218822 RepID=UPI003F7064DE